MKLSSYKNVFIKLNRKDIYFIWMKLKNRKAALIQQVKISSAKYVDMFRHDCSYNIRFIFTNTKPLFLDFQRIKTFPALH